jgi:citronellyl-CoA dehydrogenase
MAVERLAGGIWTVALARRLLADTVRGLRRREIDGRPLWQRCAVRHTLARVAVQVRLLEALVDDVTAAARRTGELSMADTAVLKAAVGPTVTQVLDACLQLRGADGLGTAGGLPALLADVHAFGIAGGSTETMLDAIADRLAGAAR